MGTTGLPAKDAFQRLIDGLQTLIREHLALARAEAKDDLRAMARDAVFSAAGLPALLVGYLLMMVSIALALGAVLPLWASFAVVAFLNLGAGGMLTLVWGKRLSRNRVELEQTGQELQKDKAWLAGLREGTAPPGRLKAEGARAPIPQYAKEMR